MIELFREQAQQEKLLQTIQHVRDDKLLRANIEAEKRIQQLKETGQLTKKSEDEKYLGRLVQQLQVKERKNNARLFDEAICKELGAAKVERSRDERSRQLLWQNAPELRRLRQQVLTASVTRDQALQLAEKRALHELKREEVLLEREEQAERLRGDEEAQLRRDVEEAQAKVKYHAELDEQRQRQIVKEEAERERERGEREAVDAIRWQIEKEDMEDERRKQEAQRELHRQAQELFAAREAQRLAEEALEKRRLLKDDDYRRATELRQQEREERQKIETENRLRLQEELLRYLDRMYEEKERRAELAVDLAVEEREEYERERGEVEEARQLRIKEDLQSVNEMLVWVKRQKEDLARKEEEEFRRLNLDRLYEEEKLELMSIQRRRMKQAEHRKRVQDLIADKRRRAEDARARELADHLERREAEQERERKVEQERLRFLREHAPELLGYLPKGVLKSGDEAERLGEEFRRFYAPAPAPDD